MSDSDSESGPLACLGFDGSSVGVVFSVSLRA